jgi:hypothetical protein
VQILGNEKSVQVFALDALYGAEHWLTFPKNISCNRSQHGVEWIHKT